MELVQKGKYYYLAHSFRKAGKVVHREKYIGKTVPKNLEKLKEIFLRKCLQEDLFQKLDKIKQHFTQEWKRYPKSIQQKMLETLAIDFTYNTNAIEGSTITHAETEDLIERGMAPNKPIRDVQETRNHAKLFFKVLEEKQELSPALLLDWHKLLFGETKTDIAGKLRDYLVRVGTYIAPDWQDVPRLMKDFSDWHHQSKRIMHPCELAARAHYKFEKIHPFGDGNGRIGRLIITKILYMSGYPLLIIEYKKRKSYYHALSKKEHDFLNYFTRRYLAAHKKHLQQST